MLPDRVSNPGPLTYESGALPIALRGPARVWKCKLSVMFLSTWSPFANSLIAACVKWRATGGRLFKPLPVVWSPGSSVAKRWPADLAVPGSTSA